MKKSYCFIAIASLCAACGQPSPADNSSPPKVDTIVAAPATPYPQPTALNHLFTQADAEKIMGEPAHFKDSSTTTEPRSRIFQCAYEANANEKQTGKTGIIYFLAEEYRYDSSAHNVYASIKKANEHNGIRTLQGLGDEAYFHSDGQNFYFIMARKGPKMIRIKVNKITASTSREQFDLVAKNIISIL